MPITPKQAAILTKQEAKQALSYFDIIDDQLMNNFLGEDIGLSVVLEVRPSKRLAAFIQKTYRKKGWTVSEGSSFITIKPFTFYFRPSEPTELRLPNNQEEETDEFPEKSLEEERWQQIEIGDTDAKELPDPGREEGSNPGASEGASSML